MKKGTSVNELLQEIKQSDPEGYNQIIEEVEQRAKKFETEQSIYVMDSEGYYSRILTSELTEDFKIISEADYNKAVCHGGKRKGSGRKKQYADKVKKTFELEQTDVISLEDYAKKNNISKNKALHEAINLLKQKEA